VLGNGFVWDYPRLHGSTSVHCHAPNIKKVISSEKLIHGDEALTLASWLQFPLSPLLNTEVIVDKMQIGITLNTFV
jgi:hypothetical protein